MQAMFPTRNPRRQVRAAAVLFVAGAILLLAGFVLHPQEKPEAADQVPIIHDNASMWALAHWVLFAGGTAFAAACFALARARYGPTRFAAGRAAFLALGVCSLLALEIFVVEATLAVQAGRDGDVSAYDALLLPEVPGLVGLLGLGIVGAWAFLTQARDDCPVLPKAANYAIAALALVGVVGDVGFVLGNETVALLEYATAGFLLGVIAFGVKAIRESRTPKTAPAPGSAAKMG